jgi:hypothetical protein
MDSHTEPKDPTMSRFARKPDARRIDNPESVDGDREGRHGTAQAQHDEEYLLSPEEAQWARALALMTGFSHGCCEAHRAAMAAGIAEQLQQLAPSGGVSGDMRALLVGLLQRWRSTVAQLTQQAAQSDDDTLPAPAGAQRSAQPVDSATEHPDFSSPHVLWHPPLETLQ